MNTFCRRTAAWALAGSLVQLTHAELLINEVMYHAASGNPNEQYIEVINTAPTAIHLTGWRLSGAVDFSITEGTIAGNGFWVIVADRAAFHAKYPAVTNYAGPWTGSLDGNSSLKLHTAAGATANTVHYNTEGDWSERRIGPLDLGASGWEWISDHDGGGSSLELINPLRSTQVGQNWEASTTRDGTPGRANSVAQFDSAPFIQDVAHRPVTPSASDSVTIVAKITDEIGSVPPVAKLYWRLDSVPTTGFQEVALWDDGAHGDGAAGDGSYGAILPPHPTHTVIEYYLTAIDISGHLRTYPRTIPQNDRTANLLYQVDAATRSDRRPLYRIILTTAEKNALDLVESAHPDSDAASSGAIVVQDGTGTAIRQLVTFRNRGHGTRRHEPHNIKVKLPADQPMNGRTSLNLNAAYPYCQTIGSAVMREAGLVIAESRLAEVLVNGVNRAGANQYGSYAANWGFDSDLLKTQLPQDSNGNLYRGIRSFDVSITPNLVWHGPNYINYTNAYFKQNNYPANDWTDLIGLIAVLNSTNGRPAAQYLTDITNRLNVENWMTYFAAHALLDDRETALGTGYGDDFGLYSGQQDSRFQLLPYDMDTLLGQGDTGGDVQADLFRMTGLGSNHSLPAIDRLVKTPEWVRSYYRQLKVLGDGIFSPVAMGPLLDRVFNGTGLPAAQVTAMKHFSADRTAWVLSQIPDRLSVVDSLSPSNGFPRSAAATISLTGRSDATRTVRVSIAGQSAVWSAWEASWSAAGVILHPGLNRILITALGEKDVEVDRLVHEVWYDDGTTQTASNTITGNTVWTAANGPYLINNTVTIAAGGTLTIEPGTSVFLSGGANVVIANGGRILAEGTAAAPIWFGRAPGGSVWGGLTLNGGVGSPETRFVQVHFEGNSTTCLEVADGTLLLDHATFGTTTHPYVALDRASFQLVDCVFPTSSAPFELLHGTGGIKSGGHGIVRRCYFGNTTGYNDIMDFTGGNRDLGQPIIQYYDNVFSGGSDDILDLDGTDAWIEGNIFLHCHQNGSPDSASCISGGSDTGHTSELTILGNLFFDCDNVATAKEGNFFTLINNTAVHITKQGGNDSAAGVVNVRDFPSGGSPTAFGRGHYLEGNIIVDAEQLVRNYDTGEALVTFNRNLLPANWSGPGSGNQIVDPQLKHVPVVAETQFKTWTEAQVLRNWFSLMPGSPAQRTGPGGSDQGGIQPLGVILTGTPVGTTRETTASITIGPNRSGEGIPAAGWPKGAGYTHYRWRIDGGVWSGETPIALPLVLTGLASGPHQVEVSGRRDSGLYQDDPLLGSNAVVTHSPIWTVDPEEVPRSPAQRIRLNEVLANNDSIELESGIFPDAVELYNDNPFAFDLGGFGLTLSTNAPFSYRFPDGTIIAAGGYWVLFAETSKPANSSQAALGFKLNRSGDTLFLFDPRAQLLDQVGFGPQIADLSIGRRSDGEWSLGHPTFGFANQTIPMGDPRALRINEWLAAHSLLVAHDFIELYNGDSRPVDLGGLFLANASGNPAQNALTPLSFISGFGLISYIADGAGGKPDHVNFNLAPEAGFIGLSSAELTPIDRIVYGPQSNDVSEGRLPNGSGLIGLLPQPSPGGSNPGSVPGDGGGSTNITTITWPLIAITNTWKYWENGDQGTAWRAPSFSDTAWPSGPALLYKEEASLPAPKNTVLILGKSTYYFRTHFAFTTNTAGVRLSLHPLVDDGAIFWLNGHELHRLGLPPGTANYATAANRNVADAVYEGPFDLAATDLLVGDNVLAVEVHQSGVSSTDVVFGTALAATFSVTNIVAGPTNGVSLPVVLNEIFADNYSRMESDGSFPDWLELYNPNVVAVNLGGLALTDDLTVGRRFTFPAGTSLGAAGYLRLRCEPDSPVSSTNTGFGLARHGAQIFLLDTPNRGGGILDSIGFGLQIRDLTLARVPDGSTHWVLAEPTPGTSNQAVPVDLAQGVKINEWLADNSAGDDWLELYNPGLHPVDLTGYHLSDDPSLPLMYTFPPYSFLGAKPSAWIRLTAGGNLNPPDASQLNFKLKKKSDEIVFSSPSGDQLDAVGFKDQATDISEGRFPDGAVTLVQFATLSSPGEHNTQDADRDGMADDWEITHGFDPTIPADAEGDADGDGLSNRNEYWAGTDPRDPNSNLRLLVDRPFADGLRLRFTASAAHPFIIQGTELLDGPWQTVFNVGATGVSRLIEIRDDHSNQGGHRFYRVAVGR